MEEDEAQVIFFNAFSIILAVFMASFFLGIGLGKGMDLSRDIKSQNLEYNNILTLQPSSEVKKVFLIGSSSENYFYVEKGSEDIEISPISAIQSLEFLQEGKK